MPAKFNFLVAASIPAVALVPLLACGGGGGGTHDAPIIVHDTAGSGSGSGSAGCTFGSAITPTFSAHGIYYDVPGDGFDTAKSKWLIFDGVFAGSANTPSEQIVRVFLRGGCGATGALCPNGSAAPETTPTFPTSFTPKDITIAIGSDHTLQPPDVRVYLLGDLSGNSYTTIYVALAGTLHITAAANGSGELFAGSGSGFDLVHLDTTTGMVATDQCESLVSGFSWSGSAHFDGKDFHGGNVPESLNATDVSPELQGVLRHRVISN